MKKRTIDEWNERFPEGAEVTYFPALNSLENGFRTTTRSIVYELGHGEPVVALTGKSGSVSVRHLLKV